MKRGQALERAKEIITKDRNNEYGEPEDSFQIIAWMWSAYKGVNFTARDVAAMMVLHKVARLQHSDKLDTWLDICGYGAIGAELDDPFEGAPR